MLCFSEQEPQPPVHWQQYPQSSTRFGGTTGDDLANPDRALLRAGPAAALCCFLWLALLPHSALGQTLQQLCDQQGLALFLRHYATDLQQLPDWNDFSNVDATDFTQTVSQVFLPPGQHFINVSGTPYAGNVAFIYQARPDMPMLCIAAEAGSPSAGIVYAA